MPITVRPLAVDADTRRPESASPMISTGSPDFAQTLAGSLALHGDPSPAPLCAIGTGCAGESLSARQQLPGIAHTAPETLPRPVSSAIRAYTGTAGPLPSASMPPGSLDAQIAMYAEDQLLAHPGGDHYFLDRVDGVYQPDADRSLFVNRVGKDVADAGANLLNLVKDLGEGSEFKYVAPDGSVKEAQRVGLLGTVGRFFGDLLSGLTFGAYTPEGEKAPEGFVESVGHFFKKVFYDAVVRDVLVGVPQSVVNMGKDAAFAAINLLQVVPDATIGNFEWGQKLTTTVFDNGQVAVDYLTDIVPGGNAWLRVHAAGRPGDLGMPIFYNLDTAEMGLADPRWAYVRNTPFRKTIETVGSLLGDAAFGLALSNQITGTSADQRQP